MNENKDTKEIESTHLLDKLRITSSWLCLVAEKQDLIFKLKTENGKYKTTIE